MRPKQREDSEVIDPLGNEARAVLTNVTAAIVRMDSAQSREYPVRSGHIVWDRLDAYAYECIDCATFIERGIEVTYESLRLWREKFAADYAAELRRRQDQLFENRYLDEIFIRSVTLLRAKQD